MTSIYFARELVHHHAAVLAVGDLRHERRHLFAVQLPAREPLGLVVRLHLRHELGVAALGLDDRDDAGLLSSIVPAHEPVRQVFAFRTLAVLGPLDRMLLHQHPLVAAVLEGLHELVGGVRVVGQGHLRRRKPAHAAQRLEAEDGGEVMLPGLDVQTEILHRRGRRHRVAPGVAQPFHRAPVARVAGDALQVVEHIVQAHLAQAVQQGAGVFQHHARLFAFIHELRDELAHALVAPVEDRGVVVIADARVIHHVLEIADDLRRAKVGAARRDQRLVHVQGAGKRALHAAPIDAALRQEDLAPAAAAHGGSDLVLSAADIRQIPNVFR